VGDCGPSYSRADLQIAPDQNGGFPMARERRNVVPIIVALAVVIAGWTVVEAADFTLPTHDGHEFTLSEEQGKNGVLLFFFASWCAQSASQIEAVKAFVEQAEGQRVKVVGVSLQEDASTIKAFIDKKKVNYSIVLDTDMEAARNFGVEGIPTLVGVDVNGDVVFRGHAMPDDPAELTKKLTHAS